MNCLIPVACVRELCDPLENPPWVLEAIMDGQVQTPLTREEISTAVAAGRLLGEQFRLNRWDRAAHVARIAYLVVNGWKDAIEIDVGCPALGDDVDWPFIDGNHRLAAALFRGDVEILASVGGDVDYATELFGVDCAGEEAVA